MNADQLLANYERVAGAPDAVQRLRSFVVDLAVRGKLVPQDPSEEDAAPLLISIKQAWDGRTASGKVKKPKVWNAVGISDAPFDVPNNWALVRLGQAMDLINGSAFKPSDWTPEGMPIVRIQNLNNPTAAFNRYDGDVKNQFFIDTGDFLISWSGTPGTSFGAHIWDRGPAVLKSAYFQGCPNWKCIRTSLSEVSNQFAIARNDRTGSRRCWSSAHYQAQAGSCSPNPSTSRRTTPHCRQSR